MNSERSGAATPLSALSVTDFLARLRSDAPTPGGGAVAALVGALAAGLGQMAAALTIGKSRFSGVESQVREIVARLSSAEQILTRLMDEDAAAYGQLSAAFKLAKADDTRAARIARAAEIAAAVPLETASIAHRVAADLKRLRMIANPNLASDVDAGGFLARAAMEAAVANVRVNLPLVDAPRRERLEAELAALGCAGDS
ncbi:MAG: cyclodeaminase/cyclohydrolase family protein [Phycisphaerae bacterium]